MNNETEKVYFTWLYNMVDGEWYDEKHSHIKLLEFMHRTRFIYFVPNDDNRAEDGFDLRHRFFYETHQTPTQDEIFWEKPCSVLEMLIALADRMAFDGSKTTFEYFWEMMHNIHLDVYSDCVYEDTPRDSKFHIEHALYVLNHREYQYNGGRGGLFPLREPKEDQVRVELLYQMSAYLLENARDLYF